MSASFRDLIYKNVILDCFVPVAKIWCFMKISALLPSKAEVVLTVTAVIMLKVEQEKPTAEIMVTLK